MEEETMDQPVEEPEEVVEEAATEEPEPVSEEPEKEPITLDKIEELVSALQKGYTLTRQDLSAIRQNQEAIQEVLNKKNEDVYGEDEPLTVKSLLRLQNEQREKQEKEQQRINGIIEGQVNELKAQGVITSKKDEDELMTFAVKHKITDLLRAADIWTELNEAKKVGGRVLAEAKNRVKQEAGSQVGTSQKTKTEEEQGVDYNEIRRKDFGEIASGE